MQRAKEILDYMASPDLYKQRRLKLGNQDVAMLFNPDLTDGMALRDIIEGLVAYGKRVSSLEQLQKQALLASETTVSNSKDEATKGILAGDAVIIVDGIDGYLIVTVRKWDKRAVAEPPTETVMRGPREGFIEDLKTNLSMLERRLKSPALAVERFKIGRISSTDVAMVYISTVADPKLVDRVRKKLKKIDIDALVDSHYLQPLIEPHPMSIFHQTGVNEKPDIIAAKMLEGRVGIIVDGSPMVLTVPFILIEDFQSSEDYYERHSFASFLRILRYFSIIIGILLPGLYVALQTFHYDVIPLRFLVTLMNAVKGIPLTPLPEVLFVMLLFEIIREASVRMPRAVGMAMSIVGALVLGDTAVKAGIISSPAVMIIALSSISLYTVPNEVGTMSLLRIIFTLMGGLTGLYGLMVSTLIILHLLVTMDSFGTPYLAPLAPLIPGDLKDAVTRQPMFKLRRRPRSIPNINSVRQKEGEDE